MNPMDTVQTLAQEYVETYKRIRNNMRKYDLNPARGLTGVPMFRWTDTYELANTSEINAEMERVREEVEQSVAALRDKAYIELDIENRYRVSKRVFDAIFANASSPSYVESVTDACMMNDARYWEKVLSSCVNMCEIIPQALEDTQQLKQ